MAAEITPEARMQIIELLAGDSSVTEVAEELGWNERTIRKIRREAIENGEIVVDSLAGVDQNAVIRDYNGLMKIREICEKYELKPGQIYRILAIAGVEPRKYQSDRIRARERAIDEAVAMYNGDFKIHEIESETGISQVTLHKYLRLRGVKLRRDK